MTPTIVFAGNQIGKEFPYISFSQLNCNFAGRNTCGGRYEDYLFQFCLYDNVASNLLDMEEDLRELFDNYDFNVENRLNQQFIYRDDFFTECKTPGEYQKDIIYSAQFQKLLTEDYLLGTIEASNIFNALYKRFSSSTKELQNLVHNFSTTKYGRANWERPFLFIPNYKTVSQFDFTCSRISNTKFSICFDTPDPVRDYCILDEIDYVFSYMNIDLSASGRKRVNSIEWLGNSFNELKDIGYWRGEVRYEILVESPRVN